jgi:hypothetical protein
MTTFKIVFTLDVFFSAETTMHCKQSESRLDNGVISINLSRTFFTGIGHVLEYIDQVLKIHSF